MKRDFECCAREDGSVLIFCDLFCSEQFIVEHFEAHRPLPAGLPTLRVLDLVSCAYCAWCGKRVSSSELCALCPCPKERPWLSLFGEEVAEALFVAWRSLIGPTDDSSHLVVARLSGPIPRRAWDTAEDLLGSGLPYDWIAREAMRAAGYPLPEER